MVCYYISKSLFKLRKEITKEIILGLGKLLCLLSYFPLSLMLAFLIWRFGNSCMVSQHPRQQLLVSTERRVVPLISMWPQVDYFILDTTFTLARSQCALFIFHSQPHHQLVILPPPHVPCPSPLVAVSCSQLPSLML